ncbi:Alpha/Beta hydrolase protein [Chytriomyces sp. MP71]|nr:Alpha/Beta hydrolase protein [Chytriomyces sp. MP71]
MIQDRAAFAVTGLPHQSAEAATGGHSTYAGLLPTRDNSSGASFFFQFFPSTQPSPNNLVIFLNGGPGCSSMEGSWIENGPFRMNDDGSLSANPHAWNHASDLLYVDQPLGTGFSPDFLGKEYTLESIATSFAGFLSNFYAVFSETSHLDLYITGESFAGIYIPIIANHLLHSNKSFNLKGIALGNPMLNFQRQAVGSPTSNADTLDYLIATRFFGNDTVALMKARTCATMDPQHCVLINFAQAWFRSRHAEYGANATCFDMYNVNYPMPCGAGKSHHWRAEDKLTSYLNSVQVRAALNISPAINDTFVWEECKRDINLVPGTKDASDWETVSLLGSLITSAGLRVLVFNGDLDLVLPYTGLERILGNASWNGATGFQAPFSDWFVDSKQAGMIVREDRGLTYIRVSGAGHMVAADAPRVGLAVLQELLGNAVEFKATSTMYQSFASGTPAIAQVSPSTSVAVPASQPTGVTSPAASGSSSFPAKVSSQLVNAVNATRLPVEATSDKVYPSGPHISVNNVSADFLIPSLPGESAALTVTLNGQYAGLLPSSANASAPNNYFFWYFPSANVTSSNLVVWLNGGPGCSSLFGSFSENGPITILDNGTLVANPFSWHKQASMLYVEQPVGTGFDVDNSNATYNEVAVGNFFKTFLDNWYAVFPEAKSKDLYITGESYAGTYIPYISTALLTNKTLPGTNDTIPLKGIAIGNPFLSRDIQGSIASVVEDYDFLNDAGYLSGPASALQPTLSNLAATCRNATAVQAQTLPYACSVIDGYMDWYTKTHTDFGVGNTCLDYYNLDHVVPCNSNGTDALTAYMWRADVQEAIHVQQRPFVWNQCSEIKLDDRRDAAANLLLDGIVSSRVKVIIADGDRDSVCHYVGVERALGNTTWGGIRGFQNSPNPWTVLGTAAGKKWSERGLTYVRVAGSGHMIPTDKPLSAYGVLAELLYGNADSADAAIPSSAAASAIAAMTTTRKSLGERTLEWPAAALLAFLCSLLI